MSVDTINLTSRHNGKYNTMGRLMMQLTGSVESKENPSVLDQIKSNSRQCMSRTVPSHQKKKCIPSRCMGLGRASSATFSPSAFLGGSFGGGNMPHRLVAMGVESAWKFDDLMAAHTLTPPKKQSRSPPFGHCAAIGASLGLLG